MKVLVCGGRNFCDEELLFSTLEEIEPSAIISGGSTGADEFAIRYADLMCVELQVYRPDWAKYGKSAGPKRNQLMLDDGKPDLVVAFPGGRGTADMIRRAKVAGVKVVEIGYAHKTAESPTK